MRRYTCTSVLGRTTLTLSALAIAGVALAEIPVFDDDWATGWSVGWRVSRQTSNVHSGTHALQNTDNGQFDPAHAGVVLGNDHWLSFWVNTSDGVPGTLMVQLYWYNPPDWVYEGEMRYGTRNVPCTYYVDGVAVAASASTGNGIAIDADATTWQHVKIDLTQTIYTGWPHVAHNLDPDADQVRRVNVLAASTGFKAIVDDIKFYDGVDVPPPNHTVTVITVR